MVLSARLKYAREQAGLTLQEIEQRTGIDTSSLSAYENGHREPSLSQLRLLADLYRRSLSFFVQDGPLPQSSILWRDRPQEREAEEVEARFLELARKYHRLEVWLDDVLPNRLNELVAPGVWVEGDAPACALRVRTVMRLGDIPGSTLEQVLDDWGVKVFHLKMESRTASACALDDTFGPAILLSSSIGYGKSHCLAFHLYQLLLLERKSDKARPTELDEATEDAESFARHLLLPAEPVQAAIEKVTRGGKTRFPELMAVAKRFFTPTETLLSRLSDLYDRSREQTHEDMNRFRALGLADKEEGFDNPHFAPARYYRMVAMVYDQGKLSIGKLAEYLGISRREAMKQFVHNGDSGRDNVEVVIYPPCEKPRISSVGQVGKADLFFSTCFSAVWESQDILFNELYSAIENFYQAQGTGSAKDLALPLSACPYRLQCAPVQDGGNFLFDFLYPEEESKGEEEFIGGWSDFYVGVRKGVRTGKVMSLRATYFPQQVPRNRTVWASLMNRLQTMRKGVPAETKWFSFWVITHILQTKGAELIRVQNIE